MTARSTGPVPREVALTGDRLLKARDALHDAASAYAADPMPASPYATERNAWKLAPEHTQFAPRRSLWAWGLNCTRLILVNILDHLWASSRLMTGDSLPLFAHMPLSRIAVEGAARMAYLLDPKISYEQRILRSAALALTGAKDRLTGAKSLPEHLRDASHSVEVSEKQLATVQKQVERAGIVVEGKKSASLLVLGNDRVPLQPKLGELVDAHFPSRPAWYRVTSGAVHSSNWVLNSQVAEAMTDGIRFEAKPSEIVLAGVLSLEAAGLAGKACAEFYGHDGAEFLKRNRDRVRMLDIKSGELAARHQ